ncbi:hypothetical protein [Streptomyces mirabilis]|uniref:hypothetical protein n=1 Tax=Streptomyces mirabilis TaxID=68239 RepID=UPI003326F3C0
MPGVVGRVPGAAGALAPGEHLQDDGTITERHTPHAAGDAVLQVVDEWFENGPVPRVPEDLPHLGAEDLTAFGVESIDFTHAPRPGPVLLSRWTQRVAAVPID